MAPTTMLTRGALWRMVTRPHAPRGTSARMQQVRTDYYVALARHLQGLQRTKYIANAVLMSGTPQHTLPRHNADNPLPRRIVFASCYNIAEGTR